MSLVYIIHVSILQILHIKHNTQMYIFNQILISYPLLTDWVHVSTFYNYQYLKVEEGSIFFSHVILHFTTCPISTNILFLFYFIHYFSINQHVAKITVYPVLVYNTHVQLSPSFKTTPNNGAMAISLIRPDYRCTDIVNCY